MSKKQKKRVRNLSSEGDKIILISQEIKPSNESSSYLEIIDLRHPQHGRNAKFMFNSEDNKIYELLKFSQPYRSWFIGNSICSDGSLCLSTPIDPLFLLLPYLSKSKMSSTLDQLIHDDDFPSSMKLEALVDSEQLNFIADEKICGGLIVWKYNEEKTLAWLNQKVNRLSKFLEDKGVNVDTTCAVSQTFVKSTKDKTENYLRYAHGMISDYLNSTLSDKLNAHLKISQPESSKKRKHNELDLEEIKKIKIECREKELAEADMNAEKKEKASRKNPKQAALAKAATGSKSISSFFKKKE